MRSILIACIGREHGFRLGNLLSRFSPPTAKAITAWFVRWTDPSTRPRGSGLRSADANLLHGCSDPSRVTVICHATFPSWCFPLASAAPVQASVATQGAIKIRLQSESRTGVRKPTPRRDSHMDQGRRKACLTQILSSIERTSPAPAINPATALSSSIRNTPVRDL